MTICGRISRRAVYSKKLTKREVGKSRYAFISVVKPRKFLAGSGGPPPLHRVDTSSVRYIAQLTAEREKARS